MKIKNYFRKLEFLYYKYILPKLFIIELYLLYIAIFF